VSTLVRLPRAVLHAALLVAAVAALAWGLARTGIARATGPADAADLLAQAEPARETPPPDMAAGDCGACHTCSVPTARVPCLKACLRTIMVHQTSKHALAEAADSLLLDDLVDLYQPVRFSHKVHARMAEMGADCATCHHYSPPGVIPPCKECHAVTAESGDLRKPNLKGAYHRQCLACHVEWSHETKCTICHDPRPGAATTSGLQDPTDIIGSSHPIIAAPAKRVYRTPYEPGPVVTFQHQEHTDLFGFQCVDCHRQESCAACHDWQKTTAQARTQAQVHAICNGCHENDPCAKCHDKTERAGFSHNRTGWPLNPYHRKLGCWSCHPRGKAFSNVDRMCKSCHGEWTPENFSHAITGLQLDEMHAALDCAACHREQRFDEDPVCSDCHDDGRTADTAPPGMKAKLPR
jgi:predicted CXXCH cytochrome family protein